MAARLTNLGHNLATGVVYVTTEAYPLQIPTPPAVYQALDALAKLWHPIRLFPFADEVAIDVTLAAMLAACLCSAFPTCPAFGFDVPSAQFSVGGNKEGPADVLWHESAHWC